MSSAADAVNAFRRAWSAGSNAERTELLASHATGKLAAALGPEAQDGLPHNPAFAPLYTHGFTVAEVQTIGNTARARLLVTHKLRG